MAEALTGAQEAEYDRLRSFMAVVCENAEKELTALEERLAQAGAPSLRSMRERRTDAIFAILQRGSIQSDDEWRLISGALSDVEDRVLSGVSREIANDLAGRYESGRAP